jgi:hypothetical protein
MDNQEVVFVEGTLFEGTVIYDRYKGVGWDGGRTAAIEMTPLKGPPPGNGASVILVDLRFGRWRYCKRNSENTMEKWWTAID